MVERKVLAGKPTPLATLVPGIDPEIDEIIQRALKKEPNKRYQDAATFEKALERVRATHGPRRRSGSCLRRHPRRSPHRAREASPAPAEQRRRISVRWRPLEPAPAMPRSGLRSRRSRKIRRTREREPSSRASSTGRRPPRRPRRRARRHLRPERRLSGPCWAHRRPTRERRSGVGASVGVGGTLVGSGEPRSAAAPWPAAGARLSGVGGHRAATGEPRSARWAAPSAGGPSPVRRIATRLRPSPQRQRSSLRPSNRSPSPRRTGSRHCGAQEAAAPAKPPAREAKAYAREAPPNKGYPPAAARSSDRDDGRSRCGCGIDRPCWALASRSRSRSSPRSSGSSAAGLRDSSLTIHEARGRHALGDRNPLRDARQ